MDVRIQNTMYQEKERLFKQYKTSMTSPVRVVLNHESLLPIQFKAPFYPVRLKNAYLYTKYTEILDILQGQITLIYIIYRYFQVNRDWVVVSVLCQNLLNTSSEVWNGIFIHKNSKYFHFFSYKLFENSLYHSCYLQSAVNWFFRLTGTR